MSDSPHRPCPAYLEEFNEEAQTSVPESRQTANIAAKRSKPDVAKPKLLRDEFSDSGYSSHTAATLDSSLESKADSNPLKPSADTLPKQPKPAIVDKTSQSKSRGADKLPIRKIESKSRRDEKLQSKECRCSECLPQTRHHAAFLPNRLTDQDATSQPRRKAPAPVPSPQLSRAPLLQQVHKVPVPPAAHSRPRVSMSKSYQRARPMSFPAGAVPEGLYMEEPGYAGRRPAPIYPRPGTFQSPAYPQPQPSYFPFQPVPHPQELFTPLPSPYEAPLPPHSRQWASAHAPARPQSMFYGPTPVTDYAYPPYANAAPPNRPYEYRTSYRERQPMPQEEYSSRDDDFYRMPPPPPPPPPPRASIKSRQEQRPTMKHAATTSATYPSLHRRRSEREDVYEEQASRRSPRKQSFEGHERSRRPSLTRPSRTSDEKVTGRQPSGRDPHMNNDFNTSSTMTKNNRGKSVYGQETLLDLEGSVEEYQRSKGNLPTSATGPLVGSVPRLGRKKTNTSSDAGSRFSGEGRSSKEGSDVKSRSSTDRRPSNDIKTKKNSDRFAMRFNASQGVNVDFKGGVESRSMSVRPSKDGDGDMEIAFGTRGRTQGSRPVLREKSVKRYSVADAQGVREIESIKGTSTSPGDIREIPESRIIRERMVTTSRSRHRSKSRHGGRGQAN